MKNKKTLIIIALVVIVLIIGIVAFGYVAVSTDTFLSAEQSFWKYFAQNKNILSVMENENSEIQKEFKDTNTYTSNGNLTISILGDNDTSQDINLKTLTNHDNETGRTYSEAVLKNGDNDLLKVSYINSNDVYALKCEDVLQHYMGIKNANLKDLAKNVGLDESALTYIPDKIDLKTYLNDFVLTEPEKTHISNTYTNIILENIAKDKYTKSGKEQVVVSGTSYTSNKYSLTVDGETLKNILVSCLETMKNDQVILSILNRFITAGTLESNNSITNELNINNVATNSEEETISSTDYANVIDELIKSLQESSTDNTITITIYENDGNLLKTVLDISEVIKITVDMSIVTNTQSVNITIEENEENEQVNEVVIDNTEDNLSNSNTSQKINLTKSITQTEITNTFEIIPDTNKPGQTIVMTTALGNVQNNMIINSTTTTINDSEAETISATYENTIQTVTELDEIMELKNSNAIILNNYTKEQLDPFIESTIVKIGQVLDNKIPQLGINLGNNTETSNNLSTDSLASLSNNIINGIKIIGTAGICVMNEKGVNYTEIASIIPAVLTINISNYIEALNENVLIEENNNENELNELSSEFDEIESFGNNLFVTYEGE